MIQESPSTDSELNAFRGELRRASSFLLAGSLLFFAGSFFGMMRMMMYNMIFEGIIPLLSSVCFVIGAGSLYRAARQSATQQDVIPRASELTNKRHEDVKETNNNMITFDAPSTSEELRKIDTVTPIDRAKSEAAEESSFNLEMWIGERLLQKLGILVVVIGIIVLLKYSFDNAWIDELGRLALSTCTAMGLLGAGEYFRSRYARWSTSFTGGGLMLLYFVVYAAHSLYRDMLLATYSISVSPSLALLLFSAITAVSVAASLRYSSQVIAWFGLIGGYATPFLIETATPNALGLTVYLGMLTAGLLALSGVRRWPSIEMASFLLTELYLAGIVYPSMQISGMMQTLIAIAFFAAFNVMPLISEFRERTHTTPLSVSMIILNGLAVFFSVLDALGGMQNEYVTFLFLGLSAFYSVLAGMTLKEREDDALLFTTYTIGSIGLIALALRHQMGPEWYPMGFALYALLLVGLAERLQRMIPFVCGSIIMGFALLGVFGTLPIFTASEETIWQPFTSTWSIVSLTVLLSLVGWIHLERRIADQLKGSLRIFETGAHTMIAILAMLGITFGVTQLHFQASIPLGIAYLLYAGIGLAIYVWTRQLVWFVTAMILEVILICMSFFSQHTHLQLFFPTATHPFSSWAILSIGCMLMLGSFIAVVQGSKKRGSTIATIHTSFAVPAFALLVAHLWLHGTAEITVLSHAHRWTSLETSHALSLWWVAIPAVLLWKRRVWAPLSSIAIAMLVIPFGKDLIVIVDQREPFFELALWTAMGIGLGVLSRDNVGQKVLTASSVIVLILTMIVHMLSHLGGSYMEAAFMTSIWWGMTGFIALAMGFHAERAALRQTAIFLFGTTTLKLLLIDFSVLETPVRIIASIATGLLLIGGSYFYQRKTMNS